jgi:hypothetical protein
MISAGTVTFDRPAVFSLTMLPAVIILVLLSALVATDPDHGQGER